MAKSNKIELTRVNINLPTTVVEKVKEYADNLGINTTSAYIVLLNQALEQKSMIENLPFLLQTANELKKLTETNNGDNE